MIAGDLHLVGSVLVERGSGLVPGPLALAPESQESTQRATLRQVDAPLFGELLKRRGMIDVHLVSSVAALLERFPTRRTSLAADTTKPTAGSLFDDAISALDARSEAPALQASCSP